MSSWVDDAYTHSVLSPCKDCQDRRFEFVNGKCWDCHEHCKKFSEYKAVIAKENTIYRSTHNTANLSWKEPEYRHRRTVATAAYRKAQKRYEKEH